MTDRPDQPADSRDEALLRLAAAPGSGPTAKDATKPASKTGRAKPRSGRTSLADARELLRSLETPVVLVGATPFNLLGLDRWVSTFSTVAYYDPWDGAHPRVFSPLYKPYVDFQTPEQITNWLLANPEVQHHLRSLTRTDSRPMIAAVCADEETERLCDELGYQLLQAPAVLRRQLDEEFETADLGPRLADRSLAAPRRITVDAVATGRGVVVGPVFTDLVGKDTLTPDVTGWCGSELSELHLGEELRAASRRRVQAVGDWLRDRGYRGTFGVDLVADETLGQVLLAGLNLRITGATPLGQTAAGAYAGMPLFCLQLLEHLDVRVDLAALNRRWGRPVPGDEWGLVLVKETAPTHQRIERAARTGTYRVDVDDTLVFQHGELDWHLLRDESEAFFLRIFGTGDYRWSGADLGVLVVRGRLLAEPTDVLTARVSTLVESIRAAFTAPNPAPVG